MDPYHGQQDMRPEPEIIELPNNLNLDQNEVGDDGENEGNGESCHQMKNRNYIIITTYL